MEKRDKMKIPKTHEVRPLKSTENPIDKVTCYTCGRSWDDGISTGITPTPSGRCPFEYYHDNWEYIK